MIQLPRRSVTRFFIPLIDVLLLMFCIFLLMPMIRPAESKGGSPLDPNYVRQLEERVKKLEKELAARPEEMLREVERIRQEKKKALEQHLLVRVLEVDAKDGSLSYNDPEKIVIHNEAEARELMERDRGVPDADKRELYYLILYPRVRNSPFPLTEQREQYDHWFSDVAHGWDIPGAGPARGGPT